jgi:hypothetical protein
MKSMLVLPVARPQAHIQYALRAYCFKSSLPGGTMFIYNTHCVCIVLDLVSIRKDNRKKILFLCTTNIIFVMHN